MPIVVDRERLQALVKAVAGFYITERRMRRAQDRMEAALAAGPVDDRAIRSYLRALTSYFADFAVEANVHLKNIDRRLEDLYQLQFNLNAERGVAARRVEATQGVLSAIAELAPK